MWQKTVAPLVASGKLVVVGVVQEQHPDRARLYAQWRELDWPIFVDSLNLLDLAVVPIPVALDASGVVRHQSIDMDEIKERFVDVEYPTIETTDSDGRAKVLDLAVLREQAQELKKAEAWRNLADAAYSQNEENGTTFAVEAYRRAVSLDPSDGRAHFRLGVAFRRRYESPQRQGGDAQSAVDHWTAALALNPNQYIWRRRIQQYGPRLDKPYNFYFWVEEARREIIARGEMPVGLSVEPTGSEIAAPASRAGASKAALDQPQSDIGPAARQPSPCDSSSERIHRDDAGLVNVESVLTPSRVAPGRRLRVRTTLRLSEKTRPYWNNEARDLRLCFEQLDNLGSINGQLTYPNPPSPETQEDRSIEFEIAVDAKVTLGKQNLPGYALYYVCEQKGGKCRYLRQDFTVTFTVDPGAPSLR